jgi:phosphohistidine phosphatase SixA
VLVGEGVLDVDNVAAGRAGKPAAAADDHIHSPCVRCKKVLEKVCQAYNVAVEVVAGDTQSPNLFCCGSPRTRA